MTKCRGILFAQLTSIYGYTDDNYAFTNTPNIRIRISLSDFTENVDLLKKVLCPAGNERDGYHAAPVVEVSSTKIGPFDTNRKISSTFRVSPT